MAGKRLSTDLQVKNAKPIGGTRTDYRDAEVRGLWLRVSPSGAKSWSLMRRLKGGKPVRTTLGEYPSVGLARARELAGEALGSLREGQVPKIVTAARELAAQREAERAKAHTVDAAVKLFIERYAEPNLRSWKEYERTFKTYVLPKWTGRQLSAITRRDVADLLDHIGDTSGPVMAHNALAHVRKFFNWHCVRDDRLVSPIVKGMSPIKPRERARQRVLSDAEIRAFWVASADAKPGVFGALARFILLTATRRDEAAQMAKPERDGATWTIPAARYKTKIDHVVPLSKAAVEIIDTLTAAQTVTDEETGESKKPAGDFVFSTDRGATHFSAYSKAKAELDKKMLAELRKADPAATLDRWVLHDLRRTARTLMSRAGVQVDHAERVLGHVMGGVRGVYDRFGYLEEKRRAVDALAELVDRIINPPADNVVTLQRPVQGSA